MKSKNHSLWVILLFTLCLIVIWSFAIKLPLVEARDSFLAQRAKTFLAQTLGIPTDQLSIAREAPFLDVARETPFASTWIQQFKMTDTKGNIWGVNLDALGNPISEAILNARARQFGQQQFVGRLDRNLVMHLRGKRDHELVRVLAWMDEGTPTEPRRGDDVTPEESEAILETIDRQVQALKEPFVQEMQDLGARLLYRTHHVPLSAWEANAGAVRSLNSHTFSSKNVFFFLEQENEPRLNVSRVVVQANTVNARGIAGTGQRVGVVEPGRIANHPSLTPRIETPTLLGFLAGVNGHKTNVAGVIQSTDATRRGMAPSITIVDGIGFDFSDNEMMGATDNVIDNGAVAANMSFGTETNGNFNAFARYVDRKVYTTGRTIVVAISNVCANRMGSPEIAFNALAVGAFGDNNTTGFGDDIPACTGVVNFSAFLNPFSPSGDRVEPDIVAPGHQINTTNTAGGFSNVNGTSFAAPHVTGGVGLLVQRNPALVSQAERVRAIMMAAARHNIEGASRLSDRDGAGAIMLAAADRILLDGLSSFFSTSGGTTGFPITRTFSATTGQRVRVVIAWSHKSPGGDLLTRPTTDLDLQVRAPNGTIVGTSSSFDNNYEIVEFTAPATGTYTATITNFRSSTGSEFIGFAASRSDT